MEIDTLEAGAELDWLVLHHVFDWKRGISAFGEAPYRHGPVAHQALLPVSTDLADAWRVLEHAIARGLRVTLQSVTDHSPQTWGVTLASPAGGSAYAWGETVPVAICRAALRAVEAALLVKSSGDTLN